MTVFYSYSFLQFLQFARTLRGALHLPPCTREPETNVPFGLTEPRSIGHLWCSPKNNKTNFHYWGYVISCQLWRGSLVCSQAPHVICLYISTFIFIYLSFINFSLYSHMYFPSCVLFFPTNLFFFHRTLINQYFSL